MSPKQEKIDGSACSTEHVLARNFAFLIVVVLYRIVEKDFSLIECLSRRSSCIVMLSIKITPRISIKTFLLLNASGKSD